MVLECGKNRMGSFFLREGVGIWGRACVFGPGGKDMYVVKV